MRQRFVASREANRFNPLATSPPQPPQNYKVGPSQIMFSGFYSFFISIPIFAGVLHWMISNSDSSIYFPKQYGMAVVELPVNLF